MNTFLNKIIEIKKRRKKRDVRYREKNKENIFIQNVQSCIVSKGIKIKQITEISQTVFFHK